MSLFKRIKNIIKSNINHGKDIKTDDIDVNSYDKIYYDDSEVTISKDFKDKQYYDILELEYGADFEKIRKAYRKLLKKYHPDLYHNKPDKLETAKKLTEKINEAYTYFERKYQ